MSELVVMEGWRKFSNAIKWHYLREGKSLCGKYMALSMRDLEPDNGPSPDDCKACRRYLDLPKPYHS